ncbi:MAG: hypothetical protein QXG81_05390 [Ignisphaera sp.]
MEPIVRESLEVMLKRINREAAVVEARLQKIATKLGVGDWRELEELFTSRGIDNPEVDLLWSEYLYLKTRLGKLEERKKRVLAMLKG